MTEKRWLYFALGVTTVISVGAVTNQLVPLAPSSGLALSETGIIFLDGTVQTTAAGNPAPPCFDGEHRFVNCKNGTVTDTATGLIWLENANCYGPRKWTTANGFAAQLKHGVCGLTDRSGPGDWRLPTQEEWEGVVDPTCAANPPALDSNDLFGCYSDNAGANEWASGVQSSIYWSSLSKVTAPPNAWVAVLDVGAVTFSAKGFNYYVWPVRGGQGPPS